MRPVTTTKPIASTTTGPFGPVAVIVDAATHGGAVKVQLDDIRAALEATGLDHTIEVADGPDDVRNVARAAFDRGVRFVAVAGDDGSVQHVVNAAFREGRTVVEQPVIGVIPAGTGCELVRSFGLPDDVVGAVSHLRGDGTYALDVMKLSAPPSPQGRALRDAGSVPSSTSGGPTCRGGDATSRSRWTPGRTSSTRGT
jgi:hypothetical protein